MIIKSVHINKFRGLHEVDFELGSKITTIVGHNGTMKTTVLGILGQTFTISNKQHPMYGEKTIDGYNFRSQFGEKFKLSGKDKPGEHKWRLNLYPNIYKNDYFEVHSILREKNEPIRFWSTEGRQAGTGYPQIPVYYLSLKRISPIGEENEFDYISNLNEEEKAFLELEYKDIMSNTENDEITVETIKSSQKYTASIHSTKIDALAISAGQDNLGKILIAVLSFKRLMDKYSKEYKGGLLLIDEIESTFHSLAQKRLIKRLYKYATDYKIQFIFTTHSPSIIKAVFFDKYNKQEAKILYLKKEGGNIKSKKVNNIEDVILELSGIVGEKEAITSKITVFSEDDTALTFIKSLLNGGYKRKLQFSPCSIGAESYLELIRVKMQPLADSIIILDGDKNKKEVISKIKKYKAKTILFLPSNYCPEEMFYRFLFGLDENDVFWDSEIAGYDKIKCFANYPTLIKRNASSDLYKKWFNEQEKYWGKGNSRLYNYWKIVNTEEHIKFIQIFIEKYNILAKKYNVSLFEDVK